MGRLTRLVLLSSVVCILAHVVDLLLWPVLPLLAGLAAVCMSVQWFRLVRRACS